VSAKGTILVLGATGLLGSALVPLLKAAARPVATHGRSTLADFQADLTDPLATGKLLDTVAPDLIINLVGLTNVDSCEQHPDQAYQLNVKTVENVAEWLRQKRSSCHLLQISTDQVYDSSGPHAESAVRLTNYYAFSKYAGELAAAAVQGTILRTNFFGRSQCAGRSSFTDWLYSALTRGESIRVFHDVWFSPLSLATLCKVIGVLAEQKPVGVFNLGAQGGMSKAAFAFAFADALGLPAACLQQASVETAALAAYRPRDMRMLGSKLERTLGIRLPTLEDEIILAAKDYSHVK